MSEADTGKEAFKRKYVVWIDGGEGWNPTGFDNLKDAFFHESYGSQKVITKIVEVDLTEKVD